MSNERSGWLVWSVFGVVVAASWWHPPHPVEQALHHSLTVIAVAALLWLRHRDLLPLRSLILVLVFLTLHTIAARWMYSFVPYDDWLHRLFGLRLSELLGWQRNNFDRLVHLGYGLCLAPVLFNHFAGRRGWRAGWAALVAVDVIVSTGAVYELFEWGVAVTLAPSYAEAYNGQQGDLFDAQKDMAIAALGAVLAVAVVLAAHVLRRHRASNVDISAAARTGAGEAGLVRADGRGN